MKSTIDLLVVVSLLLGYIGTRAYLHRYFAFRN
jgi:nitrogen fixation-related uncharacterized protein